MPQFQFIERAQGTEPERRRPGDAQWAYERASARYWSAVREQGMRLQVSTLNTEETGLPFAEQQAAQIRAYREAFASAHPDRESRVTAGRIVLPLLDAADEQAHRPFIEGYLTRMDDDGKPRTAA